MQTQYKTQTFREKRKVRNFSKPLFLIVTTRINIPAKYDTTIIYKDTAGSVGAEGINRHEDHSTGVDSVQ